MVFILRYLNSYDARDCKSVHVLSHSQFHTSLARPYSHLPNENRIANDWRGSED